MQTKKTAPSSTASTEHIDIINLAPGLVERAQSIASEIASAGTIDFSLALAGTEMSDLDGVSAAGACAESRRLTPRLDAEALLRGRTAGGESLPSSPAGVTSPVVVTRACLSLLQHRLSIFDCGTFSAPEVEHISLKEKCAAVPAKNFTTANSMSASQVQALFAEGLTAGRRQSQSAATDAIKKNLTVLAECVPGGTTTALALLRALGIAADGLLSSSIQGKKPTLKEELVRTGLQRIESELGENFREVFRNNPLKAVECLGDPMQAFAAGFCLGALDSDDEDRCPAVILAGGSQMLAVYALVRAIIEAGMPDFDNIDRQKLSLRADRRLAVITTKWVARDPFADTRALAELVGAPYMAATCDFSKSLHAGLRAYEDGHVKEGVGAGAALALAALADASATAGDTIVAAIDRHYDEMIL
ncbi:MAG: TIGR00303 family protein [Cyanobacteria bacterium SZAS LIN-2]|nr:TIGR00303 family protein [Cyanobacteria bacterium SZAS LIN-2]